MSSGLVALLILEFIVFLFSPCQEIARHIRPESLRSMFGLTKTQNAVHCTDLPEDGILEVEYFFKVLDP